MEEDIVLTPIYKSTIYLYHECSNCKKEIYLEEDTFKPFYFKENIKFCPFCGRKVIRYAEPKYITEIDWSWIEEYNAIIEKAYRFLEYKIHCKMTGKQIKELKEKSWNSVFSLEKIDNDWSRRGFTIQATFWVLYKKDIVKVQRFKAR